MGLFDKKTKPAEKAAKTATAAPAAAKPAKAAAVAAKDSSATIKTEHGVYGVLISPLITEKSTKEEQQGKYVFAVAEGASKSEIIKAIATRYGVKPVKINVQNRMGKVKRFGRSWGKRKDWRKAVVTLPKGKSINVYETGK